jgi:thiamine transport system permease protein
VFYCYPLADILALSMFHDGAWDTKGVEQLLEAGFFIKVLWFTTWQAAVSTLLTLIAALPGAYVFARYRFRGKALLQSLTAIPFVLPSVVVASAFYALLGPRGLVNTWLMNAFRLAAPPIRLDQSIWFILLAHVFYNYIVVVRIVGGFWSKLQPALPEAARVLGASPWKVFREITLPLLRPALLAASLLVFIFCFSSFGVILILGGPRFATIEVEIYRQAVHLFNLPVAATLSLIQMIITFAFMWVYTTFQRKTALPLYPESNARTERKVSSLRDRIIVGGSVSVMLVLLVSPLLALLLQSVHTDEGFTLQFFSLLFENREQSLFFIPPVDAVAYSLGFAVTTLLLAVAIGLLAAVYLSGPKSRVSSVLDPLFMLPLSTSAVTLGLGFIVAFDEPPLNLRTSILLVPLAHALVAYPFVVRSVLPALRSIPGALKESAALLGASPMQVFLKVTMPIVSRAIIVGAVFAFTISIGEFGATMFVARPQTPTMPLAIFRFLSQPGELNYGQAMAMSTILMLVTAAGFLFLDKIRLSREGEI